MNTHGVVAFRDHAEQRCQILRDDPVVLARNEDIGIEQDSHAIVNYRPFGATASSNTRNFVLINTSLTLFSAHPNSYFAALSSRPS